MRGTSRSEKYSGGPPPPPRLGGAHRFPPDGPPHVCGPDQLSRMPGRFEGARMSYETVKKANRESNSAEILEGALYLQSRPIYFHFSLLGPCNLNCLHCRSQSDGRTSDVEVSDYIYEVVLQELMPSAYVCNLGGSNLGEMTISRRFHPFLLDCKKYGVKVNLTTNGTLIQEEWVGDLMNTLTVIGFSMEGMEGEFERIRGFSWRSFLRNVERVCQARADHGKDFRVEWRYCAHSDSIHQLPDMVRLAHSIGVDRIQIMSLIPHIATQKYKMLYYHRTLANKYFEEARQVARQTGVTVNVPPSFNVSTWEKEDQTGCGSSPATNFDPNEVLMVNCYRPWQSCTVSELGIVRPSTIYWRAIGDLTKQRFDAIWNGRRYRALRKSVNTKPGRICRSCRMPRFDSDKSISFAALSKGVREIAADVVHWRPKKISFSGSICLPRGQWRSTG